MSDSSSAGSGSVKAPEASAATATERPSPEELNKRRKAFAQAQAYLKAKQVIDELNAAYEEAVKASERALKQRSGVEAEIAQLIPLMKALGTYPRPSLFSFPFLHSLFSSLLLLPFSLQNRAARHVHPPIPGLLPTIPSVVQRLQTAEKAGQSACKAETAVFAPETVGRRARARSDCGRRAQTQTQTPASGQR
jgi:hypothetical protein